MADERQVHMTTESRRFSTALAYGLIALFFVLLVSVFWPTSEDERQIPIPMTVIRELDGIRVVNDTDGKLSDCVIHIDGGYTARLDELGPRGRATVPRSSFSRDVPRDEFYTRSLRQLQIFCYDDANVRRPAGRR